MNGKPNYGIQFNSFQIKIGLGINNFWTLFFLIPLNLFKIGFGVSTHPSPPFVILTWKYYKRMDLKVKLRIFKILKACTTLSSLNTKRLNSCRLPNDAEITVASVELGHSNSNCQNRITKCFGNTYITLISLHGPEVKIDNERFTKLWANRLKFGQHFTIFYVWQIKLI